MGWSIQRRSDGLPWIVETHEMGESSGEERLWKDEIDEDLWGVDVDKTR